MHERLLLRARVGLLFLAPKYPSMPAAIKLQSGGAVSEGAVRRLLVWATCEAYRRYMGRQMGERKVVNEVLGRN